MSAQSALAFNINMAWREMRSSWRRLLLFFVSIGLGVAAIVTVRSMIHNVDSGAAVQAREFMGADLQLSSDRPWTSEELDAIKTITGPAALGRTETVDALSTLRPPGIFNFNITPIQLKGIEPGFPFYGTFELAGGQSFSYALVSGAGALASRSLVDKLGLKIGDRIAIGRGSFQIRGIVERSPGGAGGIAVGHVVFVEKQAAEAAGLAGVSGAGRHTILFKLKDQDVVPIEQRLKDKFASDPIRIFSYTDSEQNISTALSHVQEFMSLVGLIILVLGGIGISSVTRVFVEQKRKSIAVLKCVGATSVKIIGVYLVQIISLGLAGSLLGVGLARLALIGLQRALGSTLPRMIGYRLEGSAVAEGLLVGVLISILFSALPLLRVKRVRASMLLRDIVLERTGPDLLRLGIAVWVAAGLILLAAWQGGSLRMGIYFMLGLAVTASVLYAAAALLIFLLKRLRLLGNFAVRHAIGSMYRPGNQTKVIVMAVGLGAFLVIVVWSLQSNLLKELDFQRGGGIPDLVLVNVQKGDQDDIRRSVSELGGRNLKLIPIVRGRLASVDGQDLPAESGLNRRNDEGRRGRWRDYSLTYRPDLNQGESIVSGKFWDESPSADPEISLDDRLARNLNVKVGGTLGFSVDGKKITARITSIRHNDNPLFSADVVFRPGTLEPVTQLIVATLTAPDDQHRRGAFERALADRFPTVSVIDNQDTLRQVERIVHNIAVAVSFLGGLVLACGALILVGSVAMTKFQRIYEIAVMKTLGARRATLVGIMFAEYCLMGLVAGIIGSAAGSGLSYVLSHKLLEIHFSFALAVAIGGAVATALLVTIVGAGASYDALAHKPLAILRSE